MQRILELVELGISQDFIVGLKKLITSSETMDKITSLAILIKAADVVSESDLNQMAFHFMPYITIKNIQSREEEVMSMAGRALG
jgi:hypothetical protein